MQYIEIAYLVASAVAVIAMAPQIKQLLLTKESDELSITTWAMWTLYQAIALAYSMALYIIPYIVVNLIWVTFYATIVCLIIKYRKKPVVQSIEVEEPSFLESFEPNLDTTK
jgi:uncharacterized protein with PQ loop repeat